MVYLFIEKRMDNLCWNYDNYKIKIDLISIQFIIDKNIYHKC